ncbi:MAG: LemA family protein [Burkholderiaceae bacterium]|nr:LemA family protein [Burkholderiaceae bacterium]
MLFSPLFWILLAVMVFWAVGAYNRLVRLRSAAIQAFGGLDVYLVRMMALPGGGAAAPDPMGQKVSPAWQSLQAAATQFGASLAVARAQPLQADAAAALSTALQVLCAASDAMMQAGAEDDALPGAAWAQQWESLQAQRTLAQAQFNQAVVHYNEALAQFPARLLAGVFGFKPGRIL